MQASERNTQKIKKGLLKLIKKKRKVIGDFLLVSLELLNWSIGDY